MRLLRHILDLVQHLGGLFAKIFNSFKLKLPINFAKSVVFEGVLNTPLTSLNASNT